MPYEIYADKEGLHRWRLKDDNGEIIATGEAHTSERDAERAIENVREQASAATIDRSTDGR